MIFNVYLNSFCKNMQVELDIDYLGSNGDCGNSCNDGSYVNCSSWSYHLR